MKTRARCQVIFTVALGTDVNSILNTFPHPVIILNSYDGITYANPGAEQFFAKGAKR